MNLFLNCQNNKYLSNPKLSRCYAFLILAALNYHFIFYIFVETRTYVIYLLSVMNINCFVYIFSILF